MRPIEQVLVSLVIVAALWDARVGARVGQQDGDSPDFDDKPPRGKDGVVHLIDSNHRPGEFNDQPPSLARQTRSGPLRMLIWLPYDRTVKWPSSDELHSALSLCPNTARPASSTSFESAPPRLREFLPFPSCRPAEGLARISSAGGPGRHLLGSQLAVDRNPFSRSLLLAHHSLSLVSDDLRSSSKLFKLLPAPPVVAAICSSWADKGPCWCVAVGRPLVKALVELGARARQGRSGSSWSSLAAGAGVQICDKLI